MQTKSEADARTVVQTQAEQVAGLVDAELTNPAVNSSPCTGRQGESGGREIFSIQGAYQIPLPEAQHTAAVAKVRDNFTTAGWTITDDRTFGSSAVLTARDPDGLTVDLESTAPPTMLALIIHSPCFRAPGA